MWSIFSSLVLMLFFSFSFMKFDCPISRSFCISLFSHSILRCLGDIEFPVSRSVSFVAASPFSKFPFAFELSQARFFSWNAFAIRRASSRAACECALLHSFPLVQFPSRFA